MHKLPFMILLCHDVKSETLPEGKGSALLLESYSLNLPLLWITLINRNDYIIIKS
ncbi:hypothetical protein E6C60_4137 [Paenibacillus algicola]|uniref:Uncharacterized protein n=1 Tax=Paenibacillus algicola TaxID=2565926 RepID=A0A4P8XPR1_9BACL|nr:hypothetical protein E6C60_4137 [Paenibacillus algicola]